MTEGDSWTGALWSLGYAVHMHLARLAGEYCAAAVGAFGIFILVFSYHFLAPPEDFPVDRVVHVSEGASVREAAEELAAASVVRSPLAFELVERVAGSTVKAGQYVFPEPMPAFEVAARVRQGVFGIEATRITFPEGMTTYEMADVLYSAFPSFDRATFLAEAKPLEGTLFPDTYFWYPDVTPKEVIERLHERYLEQVSSLMPEITASTHTLSEVLIMASLVEKEGKTEEDRRMIAGVLWNRIAVSMPLQVDAVFGYIRERGTYSPSLDDLEIDSPYNTYKYRGLPPGPIDNPGIESLEAAANPTASPYLYYLTDAKGVTHYAKTFEAHKRNRATYLK